MRNRLMSLKDHNVSEIEKHKILSFCANASEEEKQIIKTALSELPPYISQYVYRSLTENLSYDDICKQDYIYLGCGDFYAYRRKGMGAIKRWMIWYGIWDTTSN